MYCPRVGHNPRGKLALESGLLEHDLCLNCDLCRKKSVSNPHMAYLSKTFGAHDATIVKGTDVVGSWSRLEQTKSSTWRELKCFQDLSDLRFFANYSLMVILIEK